MRAMIGLVLLATAGAPLTAQPVVSARAGLVNHIEGEVLLNGREAQQQYGVFAQMGKWGTLQTERGRAEVLLNPGVFLRVGRDSSIRLLSNEITDSRVELVTGTLILEAAEVRKDTAVALQYGNATISIRKRGVYRLDSSPAALRVFNGKAVAESGGERVEAGKGRMVSLQDTLAVAKFDRKESDALDLWSKNRPSYLAAVNLVAAQSMLRRNGVRLCNGWCFHTFLGIITYIPLNGRYLSPYGYNFHSPGELRQSSIAAASSAASGGGYRGDASSVYPGAASMAGPGSVTRSAPPARIDAPSSFSSSRSAPPAVERPGR